MSVHCAFSIQVSRMYFSNSLVQNSNGYQRACYMSEGFIYHGSCNEEFGKFYVYKMACNYLHALIYAHSFFYATTLACYLNEGTIGSNSCNAYSACARNQAFIGDGLCNQPEECQYNNVAPTPRPTSFVSLHTERALLQIPLIILTLYNHITNSNTVI